MEPTFSWENDTGGVDQQLRQQHFNMSEYRFDHQWSMMGDYNWSSSYSVSGSEHRSDHAQLSDQGAQGVLGCTQ